MPVEISVREVRDWLRRAEANADPPLSGSGGPVGTGGSAGHPAGAATTVALGRLFHRVFARVFAAPPDGILLSLADLDLPAADDRARAALAAAIRRAAYRAVVGPRLDSDRATLTHAPGEVLAFWEAVGEMCHWVAGLLLPLVRRHGSPTAGCRLVECERPLECEIVEPGWSDSVRVRGIADAIVRVPGRPHWCVVELKTGRTAPEADLAQAALYHLLLGGDPAGSIGLVSFRPRCEDRLIPGPDLVMSLNRLRTLIGRIAGVIPVDAGATASRSEGRRRRATPSAAESSVAAAPGPAAEPLDPAYRDLGAALARVLADHGLEAAVESPPRLGPTFARFLVRSTAAQRVARFTGLADEIALGMNLANPPMIARVGGRIAIDIERPDRRPVPIEQILPLLPAPDPLLGSSELLVGVDMEGRPVTADLGRPEHCHLLVAGTAGSGKSIWLRAAIAGLLATNTPQTLQLVLIDPKRNAFSAWRGADHLRVPIVFPDDTSVIEVLDALIAEMAARYARMEGVDDLAGLVRRDGVSVPRIVCICDEYADLIAKADRRREIELRIQRLGQKARAAGIHLVLATQTPRRNVVGGVIRANLPTCVALRVSNQVEARMLEVPGAEQLLGNGDLFLKSIGAPVRLQGVFCGSGEPRMRPVRPRS